MSVAEKVVYGILKFLIVFLLILYIYLLYEKIREILVEKRREKEANTVNKMIDDIFVRISNYENVESCADELKKFLKNKLRKEIASDRLTGYIELIKGDLRNALCELCEKLGLVYYEMAKLRSNDPNAVAAACRRLGEYRNKKALSLLLEKLKMDVYEVKYHALFAIAKIGDDEAFIKAFSEEYGVWILSEKNLIEIVSNFEGNKEVIYKKMIDHEDEYISSIFITSAGNNHLIGLAEQIGKSLSSPSFYKKIAAIKALGQMGDLRFEGEIIKELSNPDWRIRAVAAKALGEMGSKKALPYLKECLKDKEWWVRHNAAFSIIKIGEFEDILSEVFEGDDEFAKDTAFHALEVSGLIDSVKSISDAVKNYIEKRRFQYEFN